MSEAMKKKEQPRVPNGFFTKEQLAKQEESPGAVKYRAEQAELKRAAAKRRKEAKKAAREWSLKNSHQSPW